MAENNKPLVILNMNQEVNGTPAKVKLKSVIGYDSLVEQGWVAKYVYFIA